MESSHPKDIELKMRGHKLRSGVYWQGALKQKGVKQVGPKTRAICVCMYSYTSKYIYI
jgi:hypothetical protein